MQYFKCNVGNYNVNYVSTVHMSYSNSKLLLTLTRKPRNFYVYFVLILLDIDDRTENCMWNAVISNRCVLRPQFFHQNRVTTLRFYISYVKNATALSSRYLWPFWGYTTMQMRVAVCRWEPLYWYTLSGCGRKFW